VEGRHEARAEVIARPGSWLPTKIALDSESGDPAISANWFTDRSPIQRPFPLRRWFVPYAKQQDLAPVTNQEDLPQLAGANWENGKSVYKASCAVCHTIRGEGGKAGPDLTNLIYRDYDSVLRDIREPNAAINPEHVAYVVLTKEGLVLTGLVLAE